MADSTAIPDWDSLSPVSATAAAAAAPVQTAPEWDSLAPAGAPNFDQLVPYGDFLGKLPEADIARAFHQDSKQGLTVPRQTYEDAYAGRAGQANWTGSENLNSGGVPPRTALEVVRSAAGAMWEGTKTQFSELGTLLRNNWAKPGTPEYARAQEALGNVVQGMTKDGLETLHVYDRTASKIYNQLSEWGVNDPAAARQKTDRQFQRDVEMESAYDDLKSGVVLGLPSSEGRLPVDPAKVEAVSDTILGLDTLVPGIGAFKGAAKTDALAAKVLGKLETKSPALAARMAAAPVDFAANLAGRAERIVGSSPLVRSAVAGGLAVGAGADVTGTLLSAIVANSDKVDKVLTGARAGLEGAARNLRDAGGPMSKFSSAAYGWATGPLAKGVVSGTLANAPYALGAGSREEFKDALAIGAISTGLGIGAQKVSSGLDIASNFFTPSDGAPAARTPVKDLGVSPTLDTEHRNVMSAINNDGNNFVEDIRGFFKKAGLGEVYAVSPAGFENALKELVSLDPSLEGKLQGLDISKAAATQGVTLDVNMPDGKKRKIALFAVKDNMPGLGAGHESGHLIDKALSNEQRDNIYARLAEDYGAEGIEGARQKYAQDLEVDPKALSNEYVLSELFAETASAVLNSVPIGHFGPNKKGWKQTSRQVYGMVGEVLSKIGWKVPETAVKQEFEGGDGRIYTRWVGAQTAGPKTGLGFDPSIRGARAIENVLSAMSLEEGVFETEAPGTAATREDVGEMPAIPGIRPAVAVPAFPKGITLEGGVKDSSGKFVGDRVEILGVSPSTVNEDQHQYHVKIYVGKKVFEADVNQSDLQSPAPAGDEASIATETKPAATSTKKTSEETVTPRQVENVARPAAPVPPKNIHVTPAQQEAFAVKATPEVIADNIGVAQKSDALPTHEKPAYETDYYSAAGVTGEDAVVRTERRRLADAAEKTGKKNPLRAIYQKIFIPYRYVPGKTPRVFGFSYDKLIQNVDILKGWAAANKRDDLVAKLSDPQFANTVRQYLKNQSNGFGGDGRIVTLPSDTRPGSITARNPGYAPVKLSPADTQLVNLLMGIELPQNSSPASRFAAKMARENGLTPTLDNVGVEVTNPLYLELSNEGFDPKLLNSVVENLPIDRMTTRLRARPDVQFPAGDVGITRAGFLPATTPRTQGNQETRDIARGYVQNARIEQGQHTGYAQVNEDLAKELADFYQDAPNSPDDLEVRAAYRALANETMAQYRVMEAAGIQIEPYTGKGEPYTSSKEMMKDVRDNKHLYFLKTEGNFDGADNNALLQDSGVEINGQPLLVNDVFRAVHDFFGHTAEGYEFGPRGEFNAYLAHSRMFSEQAKPALAAETLAQNSFVNYGKHLRRKDGSIPQKGDTDFVALKDRPFAEQKNVVIPEDLLERADREASPQTAAERRQARKDSFRFMPAAPRPGAEEWIVTAAISFDGDVKQGRSHPAILMESPWVKEGKYGDFVYDGEMEQGFVTNKGRFVERDEAFDIAEKAGQLDERAVSEMTHMIAKGGSLESVGLNYSKGADFLPAIAEVQHDGKPLKDSLGAKTLSLIHFGGQGLEAIDPRNFGKSGLTSRSELSGVPRSYFYVQNKVNKDDPVARRLHQYGAKVSGAKIYDGDEDVLNYAAQINRAKADAMLKAAGYVGISRSRGKYQQVELFEPTEVQPLPSPTARFMPRIEVRGLAGEFPEDVTSLRRAWLSPEGKIFHAADHVDFVDSVTRYKTGEERPLNRYEREDAFKNAGWVRLASEGGEIVNVDGDLNPKQEAAVDLLKAQFPEREFFDNNSGVRFLPKASPAQEKAFKDSKVRGPNGKLLPVFHGTYSDFKKFKKGDIGYHFGTTQAANARIGKALSDLAPGEVSAEDAFDAFPEMRENMPPGARGAIEGIAEGSRTLPVFLDIKNPLRMPDVGPWNDPDEVYDALPDRVQEELGMAGEEAVNQYNEDVARSAVLKKKAEMTDDYRERIAAPVLALIREGIKSSGHDGIVYSNKFEGPSKKKVVMAGQHWSSPSFFQGNDSYIAFDNAQIMPAFAQDAKARFLPGAGLQDPRETRAYKNLVKFLTPEEQENIRRDTAAKMLELYNELPKDEDFEAASKAGNIKKGWYQRAADSLQFIFGEDTERFVGLVAAMSPQQSVQENLRMSLQVWADWQDAGRPLETNELTEIVERHADIGARVPNSVRALQGFEDNEPIKSNRALDKNAKQSGFKVESFRRNLLGDLDASTNDTWMANFGNLDQEQFRSRAGYLAFNAKIRKVADKLGLKPAEVQETIWSFFKTITEATTVDQTAKQALSSLTESDILQTPEFHEQILNDPKVKVQLERLGFKGFDTLAGFANPATPRAGSLAELALQDGGDRGRLVLGRIADRVQALKDLEVSRESAVAPSGPDPF